MPHKKLQNHILHPTVTIKEVGSGSGLILDGDHCYIVSDSSNVLYQCNLEKRIVKRKISLHMDGKIEENLSKPQKPDFEACCSYDGHHYIIGSGSTENRMEMAILNQDFVLIERKSLAPLYHKMMLATGIGIEDFNIEAAVVYSESKALFFNRGNGPNRKNGIITTAHWYKDHSKVTGYLPMQLPTINGFDSTFSDAVLTDDAIYFLATAEDTRSVYEDGAVAGSAIGRFDAKTLQMTDFVVISNDYKLEGIALQASTRDTVTFLVCEDGDDTPAGTKLFNLEMQLAE